MATSKEERVIRRREQSLGSDLLNHTRSLSGRSAPASTVAVRRQTPEEQREWEMAFDDFLAELVRQHLGQHK